MILSNIFTASNYVKLLPKNISGDPEITFWSSFLLFVIMGLVYTSPKLSLGTVNMPGSNWIAFDVISFIISAICLFIASNRIKATRHGQEWLLISLFIPAAACSFLATLKTGVVTSGNSFALSWLINFISCVDSERNLMHPRRRSCLTSFVGLFSNLCTMGLYGSLHMSCAMTSAGVAWVSCWVYISLVIYRSQPPVMQRNIGLASLMIEEDNRDRMRKATAMLNAA